MLITLDLDSTKKKNLLSFLVESKDFLEVCICE